MTRAATAPGSEEGVDHAVGGVAVVQVAETPDECVVSKLILLLSRMETARH